MRHWKERIEIRLGDIVEEPVDAVVNAANDRLEPGGGVCGAIHRAAGPELARACRALGGCPTGGAVATDAFDLPHRRVIHAVGPIHWDDGGEEQAALLASCYRESLRVAAAEGCRSIAFPSIGTGIYGYPIGEACRIALRTVREALTTHPEIERVVFVCFSPGDLAEYEAAAELL